MTAIKNSMAQKPDFKELEKQEIFTGVDMELIRPLLDKCRILDIEKERTIIHAGSASQALYLILTGRFRVHLPDDLNKPVIVLEAGQSIGEISIIDHQPASASVIADCDSRVLVIDDNIFWEMVRQSHSIAYNTLLVLAQRLRYGNTIISKIKELLSEYEYNATVDSLTGLYNRRWLDAMFKRIMQRCATNQEPLSVLMIDLDFFKQFNDTHGHIAGDRALRVIARSIMQNLRPEDLVTRYGGEELFALLPGLDLAAAMAVAERLRVAISKAEIRVHDGLPLPSLTASAGIAEMRAADTPDQLIHAADEALYRAKHRGRNAVSR